jgi:hypothetical protein
VSASQTLGDLRLLDVAAERFLCHDDAVAHAGESDHERVGAAASAPDADEPGVL